jgi:hypothetical protein
MSAQHTDRTGRSWTKCPLLRIRRLGVRIPSSAPLYPQVKALLSGIVKSLALCPGLAVSQFLTVLSDLVDLGECGLASLQVVIARVDVGLLGER